MKFKQAVKSAFSIHADTASYSEIEQRVLSAGNIHGTNLCIMMLAILIASIGLNMNSTAVIIGAMLISPLMGTIMATSYGLARHDYEQTMQTFTGLIFQVLVCIVTSTIYFSLSPISDSTSELLARTTPNIWDVLIASCGGFAGLVGTTRTEKSNNVIPGVAIATALMPPLCTVGYGIATKQWHFALSALFLFFINSWFIFLTSYIGFKILAIPVIAPISEKQRKKTKIRIIAVSSIIVSISIVTGFHIFAHTVTGEDIAVQTIDTLNVKNLSQEIKSVFPNVTEVEIGNMTDTDTKSGLTVHKVVAYITVSESLEPVEEKLLDTWLKNSEKIDKVNIIFKSDNIASISNSSTQSSPKKANAASDV